MKVSYLFTALAVGLIGQSASALDSWDGDKFIYSTSTSSQYALKVNLNDKGHATVALTNSGSATGTFQSSDDVVAIKLDKAIETTGFPVKTNPSTGNVEQVLTVSKIQELEITGAINNIKVTEKGSECSTFQTPGQPDEEVCEDFSTEIGQNKTSLILRDQLLPVDVTLDSDVKLALPVGDFNVAYVQVNGSTGEASPVDANVEVNNTVRSVNKGFGMIRAELNDGSTITYGQTIKLEGLSRVLGVIEKDGVESLVSGVIVAGTNVNTDAIDPVGTYTGVMGGDTLYEEPLDYVFNSDGFGGFTVTSSDGDFFNPWSWDYVNGDLVALRYRGTDNNLDPLVDTVDEVKACIADAETCYVYNKRSYKILAVDGNKYTMLRTFYFKPAQDEEFGPSNQSIWVMYKK